MEAGHARPLDVARVNERYFVGSLAVGMDADILALRNRLRRRYRLGRRLGGYPLYLWSCAVNVVARRHGTSTTLALDGLTRSGHVYNLLVTNTALYAGEFTFDATDRSDDGMLDVYTFANAADYVTRFVRAWRRHVAATRGGAPAPDAGVRVRALDVTLTRALPVQIDGEEYGPTHELVIRTEPAALRVRVPKERERAGVVTGERVHA